MASTGAQPATAERRRALRELAWVFGKLGGAIAGAAISYGPW